MACKCKDPANAITLGMDELVTVKYLGNVIVDYVGKSTGILYGKRFPTQTFKIRIEDAEADSEVQIV